MSEFTPLDELLTTSGLREKAEPVDGGLFRLRWGSAIVMVGVAGQAVVAIAPLFRAPPEERREEFYRKLLEHNAYMGGVASFAVQPDGWVVLHSGRSRKGLDAHELATLVTAVGRYADDFDDKLIAEFFAAKSEAPPFVEDEAPAPPAAE
jgi:hypothetical protein